MVPSILIPAVPVDSFDDAVNIPTLIPLSVVSNLVAPPSISFTVPPPPEILTPAVVPVLPVICNAEVVVFGNKIVALVA